MAAGAPCRAASCSAAPVRSMVARVARTVGAANISKDKRDGGNRVVHAFCPDCGTPIYSAVPGESPGYRCASAP